MALSFAPPPLQSLNFSSNCSLVSDFFDSWFNINAGLLVSIPHNYTDNATFWIPSMLEETATEAYFRNALPPNLQGDPTFGEVLDWEYQLRQDYAANVTAFMTSNETTSLNVPYFDFVIDQPARFCRNITCDINLESYQLVDLNGPGNHFFLFFQAAVGFVYSAIVFVQSLHLLCGCDRRLSQDEHQSAFRVVYSTVKGNFDGFSDTIFVYNLALPIALLVQYRLGNGVKALFQKDILLAYWLMACSLSSSVWVFRVGALLRRVAEHIDAHSERHHQPKQRSNFSTLSMLLLSGSLILIVVIILDFEGLSVASSFGFEQYSDSICGFEYTVSWSDLRYVSIGLLSYCAIRILGFVWMVGIRSREKQRTNAKGSSTLETWDNFFALLDVIVFGIGSIILLCYYEFYRYQLLKQLNQNWFLDGWDLGQVLAISSVACIGLSLIRRLIQNWKERDEQHQD